MWTLFNNVFSLVECTCVSCFELPDMKGVVSVWEDETATNVLRIFLILQLNGVKSEGLGSGKWSGRM